MPESSLNSFFNKIISEGTGKTFSTEVNSQWLQNIRPILEAFFHAKFFCIFRRKPATHSGENCHLFWVKPATCSG